MRGRLQAARPVGVGIAHGHALGQQPGPKLAQGECWVLGEEQGGDPGHMWRRRRGAGEGGIVGHAGGDVVRGGKVRLLAAVARGPAGGVVRRRAGGVLIPVDGRHRQGLGRVPRRRDAGGAHIGVELLVDGEQLQLLWAARGELDPNPIGARLGQGHRHPLGGLLAAPLGLGGGGHQGPIRAVKVKVIVVGGLGPAVPGEVQEGVVPGGGGEGELGVQPAVGVGVGEITLPVLPGVVPRRLDPQDAGRRGPAHDIPNHAGPIVEVGVVPAQGMVDDVHPLGDAVADGVIQVHFVSDLDEIQAGPRGDVVDDLRHRGAVVIAGFDAGAGEVAGDQRVGQVPPGLGSGQPLEANVDDGDLDPGPADPLGMEGARPHQARPLAHRQRDGDVGGADEGPPGHGRQEVAELGQGHGHQGESARGAGLLPCPGGQGGRPPLPLHHQLHAGPIWAQGDPEHRRHRGDRGPDRLRGLRQGRHQPLGEGLRHGLGQDLQRAIHPGQVQLGFSDGDRPQPQRHRHRADGGGRGGSRYFPQEKEELHGLTGPGGPQQNRGHCVPPPGEDRPHRPSGVPIHLHPLGRQFLLIGGEIKQPVPHLGKPVQRHLHQVHHGPTEGAP